MNHVLKNKHIIFTAFFGVVLFFFFSNTSFAATSSDAIAIRILPNQEHYSISRWYSEQGFKGSPQSLAVDGYEAIRDGRTVYVNVGNVSNNNLYTNIYLISYNQDSQEGTTDIFGQILSHWKFNTNLTDAGVCSQDNSPCNTDMDCAQGYCTSTKSKVIRDTRRAGDLVEIKINIEDYKNENNKFPCLSSGSYLPNKTISAWPSWQGTLGQDLGMSPTPVDPINQLGVCNVGETKKGKDYSSTSPGIKWLSQVSDFVVLGTNSYLEYNFNILQSGIYSMFVESTNYWGGNYVSDLSKLNPETGAENSCIEPGVQHEIKIFLDGVEKGIICNNAVNENQEPSTGTLDLGIISLGSHVIRVNFVNDWTYGSGDHYANSNLAIRNVGVKLFSNFDQITCWDEVNKTFADPNSGDNKLDLPSGSHVYAYESTSGCSDYYLYGGFESGFKISFKNSGIISY